MLRNPLKLVTALGLFLSVIGCYPSANPIWTPETLVYQPELEGVYQDEEPATEKNTTTLSKGEDEKSYKVVTHNGKGEETGGGVLRLVKLSDKLFYDYQPKSDKLAEVDPPLKEIHIFGRLAIKEKRVTLYSLRTDIFEDSAIKTKEFTRNVDGKKKSIKLINNTTEELQEFIKKNADKMNLEGSSTTKIMDKK